MATALYKHRMLKRNEFEAEYIAYMEVNGYAYEAYDVATEWRYYERGKSWFAEMLDHKWDA